jgi:hypothetical protein
MRHQIYFRTSTGLVIETKMAFETQAEANAFMKTVDAQLKVWSEPKAGPVTAKFQKKSLQFIGR